MFDRMIGAFLLDTGRLTKEELSNVYLQQDQVRTRLGVIAVANKLMSIAQAEEINMLQAARDARFGDLAVEKGYLSEDQLQRLLDQQGNEFDAFSQVLIDRGLLKADEIEETVEAYREANKLKGSDIEALKQGDIDKATAMQIGKGGAKFKRLFSTTVRNIYRLIDHHLYLSPCRKVKKMEGKLLAVQRLRGTLSVMTLITGSEDDLRRIAAAYTREEFITTEEDFLDAMCELLQVSNNQLAEQAGKDKIKVGARAFFTDAVKIVADEIYILEVHLCGGSMEYAVCVNPKIDLEEKQVRSASLHQRQ